MQNVHAMRADVRADYERALEDVDGDAAFAARFERFFTELWTGNDHVFGRRREHAGEQLLVLANFSAELQTAQGVDLGPYEYRWLT